MSALKQGCRGAAASPVASGAVGLWGSKKLHRGAGERPGCRGTPLVTCHCDAEAHGGAEPGDLR